MLRGFAAHQCRCDMTIVLHSRSAVWAPGICHIKYALGVTFNISRFTGLSYQQSNYPPHFFYGEKRTLMCISRFISTHIQSLSNEDIYSLFAARRD